MDEIRLQSPEGRQARRRVAIDPTPRFRESVVAQLDVLRGCLEEQVPRDHVAREIWAIVDQLDTSSLENEYSALGRHGYHPKRLLAVWVYASLNGVHHSTKVARACQTDAAYRWLAGGDSPSSPTLRRMRMKQGAFFEAAIEQTVLLGSERGLINLKGLAVDSVRIRANASPAAVRTVSRSKRRLAELEQVDVSTLSAAKRRRHNAALAKHQSALAECEARGATSFVTTNAAAALMKFPSGASGPAHRATIVASDKRARFIVGVLVDADPTDYGKAGPALEKARQVLERLGLRGKKRLVAAADAGYYSERDLQFARDAAEWVDLLIPEVIHSRETRGYFSRDRFQLRQGKMICPAGKSMLGPYNNDKEGTEVKWVGSGCGACSLRPQCTPGKVRALQINAAREQAQQSMRERFAKRGASKRYNERIATVEPVFSFLEDTMAFRRASSRHASTVVSELLLKLLAYNIDRLLRADRSSRKLCCAFFSIDPDGTYEPLQN